LNVEEYQVNLKTGSSGELSDEKIRAGNYRGHEEFEVEGTDKLIQCGRNRKKAVETGLENKK
jgi:hypothetical protein